MSHGKVVRIVTAYGIELMPLKSTSANRGIGILIHGPKVFFDTWIVFRSEGLVTCTWRPGSHLELN